LRAVANWKTFANARREDEEERQRFAELPLLSELLPVVVTSAGPLKPPRRTMTPEICWKVSDGFTAVGRRCCSGKTANDRMTHGQALLIPHPSPRQSCRKNSADFLRTPCCRSSRDGFRCTSPRDSACAGDCSTGRRLEASSMTPRTHLKATMRLTIKL